MQSKFKTLVAFISLAVLSACGSGSVSDAKKAVEERLIDPDSVKYKNVTSYSEGIVCGDVNAKNKMGGYVGYQAFIYYGIEPNRENTRVDLDPSADDIQLWCNNDKGKFKKSLETDLTKFKQWCASSDSYWCKQVKEVEDQLKAIK